MSVVGIAAAVAAVGLLVQSQFDTAATVAAQGDHASVYSIANTKHADANGSGRIGVAISPPKGGTTLRDRTPDPMASRTGGDTGTATQSLERNQAGRQPVNRTNVAAQVGEAVSSTLSSDALEVLRAFPLQPGRLPDEVKLQLGRSPGPIADKLFGFNNSVNTEERDGKSDNLQQNLSAIIGSQVEVALFKYTVQCSQSVCEVQIVVAPSTGSVDNDEVVQDMVFRLAASDYFRKNLIGPSTYQSYLQGIPYQLWYWKIR